MCTQTEGLITEWRVAPGEKVEAGDVFCAIETDKMVVDFEIQDDCIVADILAEEGTRLPVGPPVLVVVETEEELMAYQVRTTYMIAWLAPHQCSHTHVYSLSPAIFSSQLEVRAL